MIEEIRVAAILVTLVVGLFFTLVSTAGVLRLPDVYSRAHTASQADTLGAGFALAGVALSLGLSSTAIKTVLLLFFIFVTNPTAAHAIARAADEEGIEPWTTDDDRTDRDLFAASNSPDVEASDDSGARPGTSAGTPESDHAGASNDDHAGDSESEPTDGTGTTGGEPA